MATLTVGQTALLFIARAIDHFDIRRDGEWESTIGQG